MRSVVLSLVLLALCAGVAAGSVPITGYGDVHFGDSLQAMRKAFPKVKLVAGDIWGCDVEAPYFSMACITLATPNGRLESILVLGRGDVQQLNVALAEKYGIPDDVHVEDDPEIGRSLVKIWSDPLGNRLKFTVGELLPLIYLKYDSSNRVAAEVQREQAERESAQSKF